ncbi:hypothetical protein ES704_03004 [subsurface metagenome]|jgi:hypothetical protein
MTAQTTDIKEIEEFIKTFDKKKEKNESNEFLKELFTGKELEETPDWALSAPEQNNEDFIDKDYLKERGFDIPEAHQKQIVTNLKYMKARLDIDFTIKDIDKTKGTIRSKTENDEIDNLQEIIKNNLIKLDKNHITIPKPSDFEINRDIESSVFKLTHVAIDTEADHHSELLLCQSFNLEARRLVLCLVSDEYSITCYEQPDKSQIIYMTSPNPLDCIIISDIETVLASILISALQQGHKKISELYSEIQEQNTFPFPNYKILKELLYDERKTLYILHNAKYDVEQLKTAHSNAKRQLYSITLNKPEKIKINNLFNDYQYKLSLGNIPAGFRFNLSAQKRGMHKKCKINIAPAQAESYPLSFLCDTLIVAFAFQEKSLSLLELSKHTKYEKIEVKKKDLIFKKEELFDFVKEDQLTDKMKYSIYDTYATIAIYEKLSKKYNLESLSKILNINLERTKIPFCSQIHSTATICKHIIMTFLEQKTKLDRYKIQDNIKKSRKLQENFNNTYLGAKTSIYAQGLIKATDKMLLYYLDYASLYPHTAWLSESEKLYILCAKNELHKFIKNDVKTTIDRIKTSVNEIITCIKTNKSLEKSTFQRIIGNCTIQSNIHLQLARKHKNRRTEINTKGRITATLADLTSALVRKIITEKTNLRQILSQINFISCEYIEFNESVKYGKELFTELYLSRKEIKKEITKLKQDEKKDAYEIYLLEVAEQTAKYIMTSSYGVSGEGISNEDFTGLLFNPVIFGSITAVGRLFSSIAEISCNYYNILKIYTDTDSIIIRSTKEQKEKLCSIFSNTIELKDEIEDKYPNKNIKIEQIYIASKKNYGYILSNGEIKFTSFGKGQYESDKFKLALEEAYRYIFTTKFTALTTVEAGNKATQHHSYLQNINLDSSKSSMYKSLIKFNTKTFNVYTFDFDGIPIYVKYNYENDSYLVTNVRKVTKGIFGKYLNVGKIKHKLVFFISIPFDVEKLIKHFIETFYIQDMDIIFKQMKAKDKWQEFYDYLYLRLQEYQTNDVIDFDKEDIKEYFNFYFKKLCNFLNLNYEEQLNNEMLNIFERFVENNSLDSVFRKIAPQKLSWYFSGESYFIEEKMFDSYIRQFLNKETKTYKVYHTILEKLAKKETIHNILTRVQNKDLAEFQGLEDRLKLLKETITEKKHIKKRFEKYFQFDKTKVSRDIDKYVETFKITKVFEEKVKDKPILNISNNLNKILSTDGFSYHITIPIPTLRFSNELKANLDYYYSQIVLNTALSASKIYYALRDKGNFTITKEKYAKCHQEDDELYNKLIYMNSKQLPCPKLGTFIMIPLRFSLKPILKKNTLSKEQFNCLNKEMQQYLLDHVIEKTHKTFFIVNTTKYLKYEEKFYNLEWQTFKHGKHRFSVTIEKQSSSNYNSSIILNILPEKQGYAQKRFITATLRINPLSFNMVNLNLYKTTANNLIKSDTEILKLIKPLFLDDDIHVYSRNQSLSKNDGKEKLTFWRNLTYIMFAKNIVLDKLKYASVKLTELTISEQKHIKVDTDLFMSMLQARIIKKYHNTELKLNSKALLERQKNLYVYPHKSSRGISVNNINEKFAVSIYAKDSRWLQSKVTRIGHKRQLSPSEMQNILKEKLNPHLIRYEQALFGMDAILRFNHLNQIAKMIQEVENALAKLEKSMYLEECYNKIDNNILPLYLTYETAKIHDIDKPPPFNAL